MTSASEGARGAGSAPPRAFLIAGASGMLGTALRRVLAERGARFLAPAEHDFDITDPVRVRHVVADFAASLAAGERGALVNAAAFTDVERAEDEPELAYLVNTQGAANVARAAATAGLAFAHVSTDFVFDGRKSEPCTEDDEPHPLSVYGASKLAGDEAVFAEHPDALVVRTAWVFGAGGANFPSKILSAAREGRHLQVVSDEVGSPTFTYDLARGILGLLDLGATGLFNLAGAGSCSRFELARATLDLAGLSDVAIEPVSSAAFATRAKRPAHSVLDCSKAASLGVTMREWREALAQFVGEM
jgi:dTDP-4-dehydrorhamnose reductase